MISGIAASMKGRINVAAQAGFTKRDVANGTSIE